MLILPSVGASVQKIVLNESATKAKLYFNDGTTTIIQTSNTPAVKKAATVTKLPNGKIVTKKKLIKRPGSGTVSTSSVIKTHQGPMSFSVVKNPDEMAKKAEDVIERAKKRAAMLEARTMDSSAKMGLNASDGQEYVMNG